MPPARGQRYVTGGAFFAGRDGRTRRATGCRDLQEWLVQVD